MTEVLDRVDETSSETSTQPATVNDVPASSQWADVYMRKGLDDNGTVPYPGTSWTWSPDIVPNGTTVMANAPAVLAANYGTDPGLPTVPDQPNFYYVRAKNLFGGQRTATFELYYCPANLFLLPSLWSGNQLSTSSGALQVTGSAANNGDVLVATEPFAFNPPDSTQHHCLVSRLTTPGDPNPMPADFATLDALGTFILNHPDFAWRNVVTVDGDIPTFTHTFAIDTTVVATGGTFMLGISYKNLTVGSKVSFSAGTPIPSGPDQGSVIQLVETPVSQSSGSIGTTFLTIPAGYHTNVSYSYFAQTPILGSWSVEFFALLVTSPTSALHAQARPLSHFAADLGTDHPLFSLSDASGAQMRAVKVGSCATRGV